MCCEKNVCLSLKWVKLLRQGTFLLKHSLIILILIALPGFGVVGSGVVGSGVIGSVVVGLGVVGLGVVGLLPVV